MCGITGFVDHGAPGAAGHAATVRRMTETLVHRGPDGAGTWVEGPVALGHRRLSVIDLHTGDQPMTGEQGCVIVFNGEIYNYRDLRAELEAKGARFRTDSDTEVLLALYEREGEACLERLIGMFAFAVWDPRDKTLFLARDRLGKKPLYVFPSPTLFAFASEMKALLELDGVRDAVAPDPRAISDFLSFGYVLGPKSILRGIEKLPPGCWARLGPEPGDYRTHEYWKVADAFNQPRAPYDAAARERFEELFHDAVSVRLHADVPLGAFLSGGIDSAAVVAAMARRATGGVHSYCVGFEERSFDESPYARQVADHLGVDLEVLPFEAAIDLHRLAWHFDEPFADTSFMPTFVLNRAARRRVTVALSGDGGDEVLAGYPTQLADWYYRFYRRVPGPAQKALSALADRALGPSYRKVSWDYKARQFLRSHGMTPERAHSWWREVFPDADKRRLMSAELKDACGDYDPFAVIDDHFAKVARAPFLEQTLYVDLKTWLPDDILVKVDRMSMANGLEVRSPFLDHRLVEFAAGLDSEAKMRGRTQKVVLKDVFGHVLPGDVVRRPKRGFNAPTQAVGAMSLDAGDFTSLFEPAFVLDSEREDVSFKILSLRVLGIWLKAFSDYGRGRPWGECFHD